MENKLKQYFPIIQQIYFYGSIKGVYTIVLFEKKPGTVPQISRCIYPLYVFIPLDIFSQTVHNNGIRNLLEAWLVFLSIDSPELMISLITEYPKFKVMYEHLYYICQNVERMMEMYSEELKILDRNTVKYMVDQMQEQIDNQKEKIAAQEKEIQMLKRKLEEQK